MSEQDTSLTDALNGSSAAPEALAFHALIRGGANNPAHRASRLTDGQFECVYGDVVGHLEAIQRLLQAQGCKPGDCVAAELSNSLCSALTVLALLDGGYNVMLTRHPALEPTGSVAKVPAGFCRFCISVSPNSSAVDRVLSRPETYVDLRANAEFSALARIPLVDRPCVYSRTSGSLGSAKTVARPFGSFSLNIRDAAAMLRFDPAMRMALTIPIFHLFGLGTGLLLGLHSGVSIDLQDRPNVLDFFEREAQFDPDTALVIPTFCESLLRVRRRRRPYRFMLTGGDATSKATRERAEALHGPLLHSYGSSEMGILAITEPDAPPEIRASVAYRLLPGVSARLSQLPGDEEGDSSTGELLLRSAYRFRGYVDSDGYPFDRPESFEGDWFRTGDLARLTPEGRLQVVGRCDLCVNRNGLLLPFADVEARLREIPGVEQATVVAGAETIRGRALVAFCVPARSAELTEAGIREWYAAGSPPWSVPDLVRIVPALPQLASGKVDRRALEGIVAASNEQFR